jgi:cytochrome o ubiquinol oxidase subunit 2
MFCLTHGANIPVLHPAGPIAGAEKRVIIVTLALASLIVVPVFFLLFFFAWKYRDTSPDAHVHHHPSWDHDNPTAEFLWWLGPSAIIAVLAVVAWQSSHALDPYVPLPGDKTLEVQVIALDWKWLFIYPELGIASVNELTIPAHTPVHFVLTADAPMNSFWVPSLGGMIMVMPGMQTQLNLAADREGVFDGFSGNLSGKGFSGMAFKVRSVSRESFGAWALSVAAQSSVLDTSAYVILSAPSSNVPVRYYSSVDRSLYTSVHAGDMSEDHTMMHMDHSI